MQRTYRAGSGTVDGTGARWGEGKRGGNEGERGGNEGTARGRPS